MNDSQYNFIADELLLAVEEAIEDCGTDIDYEGVGGLLTLSFKNGTKIIINKQAPLHEVWVATKFNDIEIGPGMPLSRAACNCVIASSFASSYLP